MIRLFSIEWLKLSKSRYFKWMIGLWLIAFLAVPFGLNKAIDLIVETGGELYASIGFDPAHLPIFSFTDLWHNLAYVYKLMTLLLSIIVIVNVGQEWEEKTMRQNVIDGMSRLEYFISKEVLLLTLTAISTGLFVLMGLVVGFSLSADTSMGAIVGHMDFVAAYALHVFLQLNIAMVFINLFRKVGVTILLFLVYLFVLVPVFWGLSELTLPDSISTFYRYMPVTISWDVIPFPFEKYLFRITPDHVRLKSMSLGIVWAVILLFINNLLTTKRDLR